MSNELDDPIEQEDIEEIDHHPLARGIKALLRNRWQPWHVAEWATNRSGIPVDVVVCEQYRRNCIASGEILPTTTLRMELDRKKRLIDIVDERMALYCLLEDRLEEARNAEKLAGIPLEIVDRIIVLMERLLTAIREDYQAMGLAPPDVKVGELRIPGQTGAARSRGAINLRDIERGLVELGADPKMLLRVIERLKYGDERLGLLPATEPQVGEMSPLESHETP